MTSSVSWRRNLVERNNAPRTGKSPSQGVLSIELLPTFFSRPPIAKLCPDPSSTVVSALRVASAGMVKPPKRTEPASVNSETSGRTRNEMRPSLRTVGGKRSEERRVGKEGVGKVRFGGTRDN